MNADQRTAARRAAQRERVDTERRRGPRPVLTAHEIETMIRDLSDRMERDAEDFADLCDQVYEAEMDYEHAFHSKTVELASGPDRHTADVRKSMAWLASEDKKRAHKVLLAAKEAAIANRFVNSSRLDGMRTLAANVRGMT